MFKTKKHIDTSIYLLKIRIQNLEKLIDEQSGYMEIEALNHQGSDYSSGLHNGYLMGELAACKDFCIMLESLANLKQ